MFYLLVMLSLIGFCSGGYLLYTRGEPKGWLLVGVGLLVLIGTIVYYTFRSPRNKKSRSPDRILPDCDDFDCGDADCGGID
jgi:peptidoglycan/LPS O-acetylase OafA/YrhL